VRRLWAAVCALVGSVALLTGCAGAAASGDGPRTAAPPTAASPTEAGGELTIFAAASLGAAFDDLARQFESENPGIDIRPIVYDGSSTLARQLLEGAEADIFASADEPNMGKVAELVDGSSAVFATNTLVIATPEGNPADVGSLGDLSDPGLTVVLCGPEVPCGAASQRLLELAGVSVVPASLEQNVTAVLTKVASGDADAGLVYRTDVVGRTDVESIVPDGAAEVVNRYPIAALKGSENPEAARAFVEFVTGPRGQEVLASHGFGSA